MPSMVLLIMAKVFLKNERFKNDLKNIKDEISNHQNIDKSYLIALIAAEDHRFNLHFGVDFIAIVRAIYITNIKHKFQGASTIEQQLVQVITFRYERTLRRKFREQLLATLISSYFQKSHIASSYLNIAYFGYNMNGINNALKNFDVIRGGIQPALTAALLKYPKHKNEIESWQKKVARRVSYINNRKIKYKNWL